MGVCLTSSYCFHHAFWPLNTIIFFRVDMGTNLPQYVKQVVSAMRRAESERDVDRVKTLLGDMMLSRSQRRRRWALAFLVIIVYGMRGAGTTLTTTMTGSLPTVDDKHIDVAVAFGERAKRLGGPGWAALKKTAAGAWPALESGSDAVLTMARK